MGAVLSVLESADVAATHWFQRDVTLGPLELLLLPGAKGFGWAGAPLTLCGIGFVFGTQRLWFAMMSVALAQTFSRAAKGATLRVRPHPPPGGVTRFLPALLARAGQHLRSDGDGPAFPSGDAVVSGAIGGSLALASGAPAYLALTASAVLARVYYLYHWFGDTVAGAALGLSASVAVDSLYKAAGFDNGWRDIKPSHVAVGAVAFTVVMRATSSWDKAAAAAAAASARHGSAK